MAASAARDGIQLGASLIGMYAFGGTWLGGICSVSAYNSGSRLVAKVWTQGHFPSGTEMASGVLKHFLPAGTNFPIESYKEKIKNSAFGGAVGFAISKIPFFETVTGMGTFTLTALSAAGGYILTDIGEDGTQPPPLRRAFGNALVGASTDGLTDSRAETRNVLDTRPLNPVRFGTDGTISKQTIREAYQYCLDHTELQGADALYQVAYNAFLDNPRIIPRDFGSLGNEPALPSNFRAILQQAATTANAAQPRRR